MDAEKAIAQKLKDATNLAGYMSVPKNTPDEFFTVMLTSAGGSRFMQEICVDVDVWGKDEQARARARKLAEQIGAAVYELDELENIFAPKLTNMYYSPDADTGRARYVVQVECYVCE